MAKQREHKDLSDWYNVSQEDIYKHGGRSLLTNYFHGSPSKAIQSVYPEHNWMLWRSKNPPVGYWDKEHQKQFFDWLKTKLEYKSMEDWYQVTKEDIGSNGGQALLQHYFKGSPSKALQEIYPQHQWQLSNFLCDQPKSKKGESKNYYR